MIFLPSERDTPEECIDYGDVSPAVADFCVSHSSACVPWMFTCENSATQEMKISISIFGIFRKTGRSAFF